MKWVNKMAISYKTILYILPLQMASLYNIAVALNLERLYNKTSYDNEIFLADFFSFLEWDQT